MRYLSFRKNSQIIAAGILLADTNSILDLSHPSCIGLLGNTQPNLLDMVRLGLEPISKRIKESLKNDSPDKDAVIELKDVTFCPISKNFVNDTMLYSKTPVINKKTRIAKSIPSS